MDTMQLVDDERVRVYTLKKGINDTILYDAALVKERYGFSPELIPDYKGLRGDPSDNIKGIPGVGEKTATTLITTFGTLEKIYKELKKGDAAFLKAGIKARMIDLLREHREDAEFSKMLATIRTDAPIAFSLPDRTWREGVSLAKILATFDEFGFRSLKERARVLLGGEGETEETLLPEEPVDAARLQEAQVMLWLLASEFTNPSLEDILAFTKEREFERAYAVLTKHLTDAGRLLEVYERIEKPLIPIVASMQEHGIRIDEKVLEDLSGCYGGELRELETRIYTLAGHPFNINSPQQLGVVLFDELGLKPEKQKRTAGGARSTKESELEKLKEEHGIVSDILEYRELKKLLSTYIETLPRLLGEDKRLHATFLQTGTTTGRMSSQGPNLQNIPLHSPRGQAIRHAFVASPGFVLLALDYSQIELRIAAFLSKDEKLCAIFRAGRDVHKEVAAMVFGVSSEEVSAEMRRRAKVINFGILYCMGVNALRAQLGSTTAEAHAYLENYFHTFKTLSEYLESTKGFARKHGYTETLFGRRRQFPEMKSTLPYVRAQAERMAINAPIQGTQSDIIKLAMVQVDEWLRKEQVREDVHLLLQVHDELVYEVRADRIGKVAPKIQEIMETVVSLEETNQVPITTVAKVGAHWGDLKAL
jgi:DNA polymerase-1